MKNTLLLLMMLACCASGFAQKNEVEVTTKISAVIVYEKSAQIERSAPINVPGGVSVLKFVGLKSDLNTSSIEVAGKGEFSILSTSFDYKTDTISGVDQTPFVAKTQKEIAKIQREVSKKQKILAVYAKEERLIDSNQNFTHKEDGTDVNELREASTFVRNRLMEITLKKMEIEDAVADMNAEIDTKSKSMRGLKPITTKTTLEVHVRINAKKATKAEMKLIYQTPKAGWIASYDAKVNSVADPLDLIYNAKVAQSTGEDWKDVQLTVATGNPSQTRVQQILNPWYIGQNQVGGNAGGYNNATQVQQATGGLPANYGDLNSNLVHQPYKIGILGVSGKITDRNGEPLIGASVRVKGFSAGAVTDINGYYNLAGIPEQASQLTFSYIGFRQVTLPISNPRMDVKLADDVALLSSSQVQLSTKRIDAVPVMALESRVIGRSKRGSTKQAKADFEIPIVQIAYTPINTKFNIELPATIPSDGKEYAVQIDNFELEADYRYTCVPKLDKQAYLNARITGWEEYNFRNGEMNVYFEDAFVGKSALDLSYVEDTLALALGADPSIVINRRRTNAKSQKQILGSNRTDSREWTITVKNLKPAPIFIRIEDQAPVAMNENVVVETNISGQGEIDETSGMVFWEVEIAPTKSKEVSLKYSVKRPRDLYLSLE